jgi:hypothetical protein
VFTDKLRSAQQKEGSRHSLSWSCSNALANTCSEGLEGQRKPVRVHQAHSNDCKYGWWSVEPCLGRVADGVPNRAYRIKCLGNAVVPAWAEAVGRTIRNQTSPAYPVVFSEEKDNIL